MPKEIGTFRMHVLGWNLGSTCCVELVTEKCCVPLIRFGHSSTKAAPTSNAGNIGQLI